jgi:hypothetical protein
MYCATLSFEGGSSRQEINTIVKVCYLNKKKRDFEKLFE